MLKIIFTAILGTVVALSLSTSVNATTLVDQSFDSSDIIVGANFSEGTDRVYDDFSLSDSNTITNVEFWGSYWNTGTVPSVLDFRIDVFEKVVSGLGDLVGSSALTIDSSVDTGFFHNDNGSADIIDFNTSLVDAITLASGDYWFSIFLDTDAPVTFLTWQRINENGLAIPFASVGPSAFGDMAWVLRSEVSAVPIPAALPLFGTGLAVMGFIGWRRKRKAA